MKHLPVYIIILFLIPVSARAQVKDTLVIHFEFNQSGITPQSASILDSFFRPDSAWSLQQIELYGHCDFIGNHPYNDSLSLARIAATKAYLLNREIPESVFDKEVGLGKRQPSTKGSTDAARAMNRRVELVVYRQPVEKHKPVVVTEKKQTLSEIIRDTAVKQGSSLVLKNLNFQGGRHFLLAPSYPVLQELLEAMQENPTLVIEIQGHVCCTAVTTDGYDLDLGTRNLSYERAKAIYNYLVENGIDPNRMTYKGFGASQKLYPAELNEMQRAQNRRVEIKIISK